MIASGGSFTTGPFCVCGGTFYINGRCVSCRGLMQQPIVRNNTVACESEGDIELRQLRQRMEQNRREYMKLIAQLELMADEKPPRKNRGLFTKKILAKVEKRFPSHPGMRRHRRQKR